MPEANNRRRAMTSDQARQVREQGHLDAKEFARIIGVGDDYQNGATDKKDVVDQNGDTHSLKSGETRWQIFLYSVTRFKEDVIYKVMGGVGDGVGNLILECLNCFPDSFEEYLENKNKYKTLLKSKMISLCGKLQDKDVFAAFLVKSIFNCGEVNYLTIKNDEKFHVFLSNDVVESVVENVERQMSKLRGRDQMHYQKVVLVHDDVNVGTIEIRHDSTSHYKQAVFALNKADIFRLLTSKITNKQEWGDKVVVYGKAINKFKKKHKEYLQSSQ